MGFFDFMNRQGGGAGFQPFADEAAGGTRIVHRLLEVPAADRNAAWSGLFLAHVADAAFFPRETEVVRGTGSFPYLALYSTPGAQSYPSHVIHHLKDDVLLERGLGVVVNPRGDDADWAFSYGDILQYHLHGRFYPPPEEDVPGPASALAPEARLPAPARKVLREFLGRLGVAAPGMRFSAWDHAGPGSLELVFAFSPRDFSSLEAFQFAMNSLSWFLPKNYSYSVAGNQARAEGAFQPL